MGSVGTFFQLAKTVGNGKPEEILFLNWETSVFIFILLAGRNWFWRTNEQSKFFRWRQHLPMGMSSSFPFLPTVSGSCFPHGPFSPCITVELEAPNSGRRVPKREQWCCEMNTLSISGHPHLRAPCCNMQRFPSVLQVPGPTGPCQPWRAVGTWFELHPSRRVWKASPIPTWLSASAFSAHVQMRYCLKDLFRASTPNEKIRIIP